MICNLGVFPQYKLCHAHSLQCSSRYTQSVLTAGGIYTLLDLAERGRAIAAKTQHPSPTVLHLYIRQVGKSLLKLTIVHRACPFQMAVAAVDFRMKA